MWFIWNIFRENPLKAKYVAKLCDQHLINLLNENKDSAFYVPSSGLLYLCGFDVTPILFTEDQLKINQVMSYFREFGKNKIPSATAIVLSLLFLKMKTSSDKYHEIRKILEDKDVQKTIYSHFDPKNRELLVDIINSYQL